MLGFSFLGKMVGGTTLPSSLGTHRLIHHRNDQHAKLFDSSGQRVMSWTAVAKDEATSKARRWLTDAEVAAGHNPLYDDLYYAQRQGLD